MRIDLSAHERTLLAGLLAEHITIAFLTPRTLYADVNESMQARFLEARTHGYAEVLRLYCDLGGARRWPDVPAKVTFEPRPRFKPEDLMGSLVPKSDASV
jgi:hypothetical protein